MTEIANTGNPKEIETNNIIKIKETHNIYNKFYGFIKYLLFFKIMFIIGPFIWLIIYFNLHNNKKKIFIKKYYKVIIFNIIITILIYLFFFTFNYQ